MHIPHCFEKTVEPVDCLALVSNSSGMKSNDPNCWCFNTGPDTLVCSYYGHDIEGLHDTLIWKTYVVLCELMVRFGPAMLLIGLNVAMIRHFNHVISANVYPTATYKKSTLHSGAKIHILSEIPIFTKFTFLKSQFSQNSYV